MYMVLFRTLYDLTHTDHCTGGVGVVCTCSSSPQTSYTSQYLTPTPSDTLTARFPHPWLPGKILDTPVRTKATTGENIRQEFIKSIWAAIFMSEIFTVYEWLWLTTQWQNGLWHINICWLYLSKKTYFEDVIEAKLHHAVQKLICYV